MGQLPSLPVKVFGTRLSSLVSADKDDQAAIDHHEHNVHTPPPLGRHHSPLRITLKHKEPPSLASGPERPPSSSSSVGRAKRISNPVDTNQLHNDRLGTLVRDLVSKFANAPSWEEFVTDFRGSSYLSAELDNVGHPAAPVLRRWRDHGVPVHTTSPPWTAEQKEECIRRGCHRSANLHSDFL